MRDGGAEPTRPVVGMTASVDHASWGGWEAVADVLPHNYALSVQRAGAIAVILPPDPRAVDEPDAVLDALDALLLAGGDDIDPALYGQPPHPAAGPFDREHDEFELALARGALARELPLLGICRGLEILNVALGGTLHQHLPELLGHDRHRASPGSFADHEVRLHPGSLTAQVVGVERHRVKSSHHQGPDRPGEGLEPTAWGVEDGIVEALEIPSRRFALGVLWHPEEHQRSPEIEALVAQARAGVRPPASART